MGILRIAGERAAYWLCLQRCRPGCSWLPVRTSRTANTGPSATNSVTPSRIEILYGNKNLYLYLIIYASSHEDVWGSGSIAPPYFISTLDRSKWSVSRPGRFSSGESTPDVRWIRRWVGPRASMDAVYLRKISFPYQGSNPCRPVRSPSLILLIYPGSTHQDVLHTRFLTLNPF